MWQQRTWRNLVVPLLMLPVIAIVLNSNTLALASGRYSIGQSLEPTNAVVDPKLTASIIIQAYNADGRILRSDDFMKATTGEVFLTGHDDLPHYAVYQTTPDGLPSFAVLPQTLYKIYAIWEVPDFGKLMLSADNEGKGYVVDGQTGRLTLLFNYEIAKSKMSAFRKDLEQFKRQGLGISPEVAEGFSLGEQHLKSAEDLIQQGKVPDMSAVVKELNGSLRSSLSSHEQLYLAKADADIEKYRKGDARLKVVDKEGKPLNNVIVAYRQTSKDFFFSATPYSPRYSKLLKEAGINAVTFYASEYGEIEPEVGRFNWAYNDSQVNVQTREGFTPLGNLGWLFFHGWGNIPPEVYVPAYLKNMTFDQVKQAVYDHYYAIVSRYKGKIVVWNALYETCGAWSNELKWTWRQKLEIFKVATDAVRAADLQAKILSTDSAAPYNHFMGTSVSKPFELDAVAGWIPYPEFLSTATDKQISIDIIGLELPTGAVDVYQTGAPNIHTLLDLVGLSSLLDQYAKFGKPLFIMDYHAPSTQIAGGNWWHRPWDEAMQAEYAKAVYTIIFSKPLAKGIDWGTGIADDVAGKFGGLTSGLLSADLTPKQSYFALKALINSWTTDGNGKTDSNGELVLRGFAGDYDVVLQTASGQSLKTTLHINEQSTSEINITFPLVTPEMAKLAPSSEQGGPTPKVATVPVETQPKVTPPADRALSYKENSLLLIASAIGGIAGLLTLFVIKRRTRIK